MSRHLRIYKFLLNVSLQVLLKLLGSIFNIHTGSDTITWPTTLRALRIYFEMT